MQAFKYLKKILHDTTEKIMFYCTVLLFFFFSFSLTVWVLMK